MGGITEFTFLGVRFHNFVPSAKILLYPFGAPQTYRGKIRLIVVEIAPWVFQHFIHYLSMIQLPEET